MTTQLYKSQRGATGLTVLLVIMLVVIGVLGYMLIAGKTPQIHRTNNVESPTINATNTTNQPAPTNKTESDGLINPDYSEQYELNEFGAGVARMDAFNRDINHDGRPDRIIRTRHENGTDHYYDQYQIAINNNGTYIDITPDGFRTTQGAECALQKLQFAFRPDFRVVKISRPWQESWTTPTMATETVYTIVKNKLQPISTRQLKVVCDVSDLF